MEDLKTFQDSYDYLYDQYMLSDARSARNARNAIHAANRMFPQAHKWSYFNRRWTFNTTAQYTTGTVTYTHSTRTVTIDGGTWPSDVADGLIKLSENVFYPVESASGADLILPVNNNPGADIAAGQTFTWVRNQYQLPVDFHRMAALYEVEGRFQLPEITSAQAHGQQIFWAAPSRPLRYTIDADFRYLGALQLRLTPPPSTAKAYEVTYKAKCRPLRTQQVSTTGTITSGTSSVTLGAAVATSHHLGSVIRFSTSATAPTGLAGANPYNEYRVISEITNDTTVVLDAPITTTYTATAVEISDPIDIEAGSMWEAFKACVNWNYCLASRVEQKAKNAAGAEYKMAMREAMAADWRNTGESPIPRMTPWGIYQWSTVPVEDVQA